MRAMTQLFMLHHALATAGTTETLKEKGTKKMSDPEKLGNGGRADREVAQGN